MKWRGAGSLGDGGYRLSRADDFGIDQLTFFIRRAKTVETAENITG